MTEAIWAFPKIRIPFWGGGSYIKDYSIFGGKDNGNYYNELKICKIPRCVQRASSTEHVHGSHTLGPFYYDAKDRKSWCTCKSVATVLLLYM